MKKIDGKYHIENETIIKSTNGVSIPDNEPLILFRGRDRLALPMLLEYRDICVKDGCTQYQIDAIDRIIENFRNYRIDHPDIMKQPGATLGA